MEALDFDFRSFCTVNLGIRRSDVYTHYLHPYPGKLLPYIPAFFLSDESLIPSNEKILDPFSGSGTVLLETLVNPKFKRSAIGVEINPLARLLSKVKVTPLNTERLDAIKQQLFEKPKLKNNDHPRFANIESWFTKKARSRLQDLLSKILSLKADNYRDFFLLCFSKIVRDCSMADPNIPPPVLLKTWKYKNNYKRHREMLNFLRRSENPYVMNMFTRAVDANIHRIKSFADVMHNENDDVRADIIWDDARSIKVGRYTERGGINKINASTLPNHSVGAIITSPPYLTAQKYIRSTKLEILWLGLANDTEIPELDFRTIGSEAASFKAQTSNLPHYKKILTKQDLIDIYLTEVPEMRFRLKSIASESIDRGLEVGRYFLDMKHALKEMYRVLKKDAYAVIVLGNSKVLKRPLKTHKYLADIAEAIGFDLQLVLRDPIRTRGMLTGRNDTGGLIENEYILVLKKLK